MRNHNLSYWACGLLAVCCTFCLPSTAQARIEAVKGKKYHLTKKHGPWMIMVASLKSNPGGKITAEEAADTLVYELRKKKIPAYTFSQEEELEHLETYDRLGRVRQSSYKKQEARVCVLAGNYSDIEDPVAQKTLAYIKRLHPEILEEEGSYRKTPGRPGPLSGAFLTINPLLSAREVTQRKRDPLLLKLNSGAEYSLLDNPGKYTLVVASFHGKSITQISGTSEKHLNVDDALYEAGIKAWELTKVLREAKLPVGRNFEAYVYHDRYRSVVTIGSFDSPDDPRIAEYYKMFGAKVKENPQTGRNVLTAEMLALPINGPPEKTYIFDPQPALMEVPRFR